MITSVSGAKVCAAIRVANTSCTKGTPQLSARPMAAEPDIARAACSMPSCSCKRRKSSAAFSAIWLLWRRSWKKQVVAGHPTQHT